MGLNTRDFYDEGGAPRITPRMLERLSPTIIPTESALLRQAVLDLRDEVAELRAELAPRRSCIVNGPEAEAAYRRLLEGRRG